MASKPVGLGLLDEPVWERAHSIKSESCWPRSWSSWMFSQIRRISLLVDKDSNGTSLRPTAWLDGLRGFAALIVYWHHHQLWAHSSHDVKILESTFGHDGHYALASLPGIRILFSGGHLAVSIFFVISGYVLSTKSLSHIHSGNLPKLLETLSSAMFRRWLRLYIPVFITTFVSVLTWRLFGGLWIFGAEKQANLRDEIWTWYYDIKNFSHFFNTGGDPWLKYNKHLWSIPVEMKGSILVWTELLALARASRRARLGCTAGLTWYFMYIADGAHWAMFTAGMLLADLDQLAISDDLPRLLQRLRPYSSFLACHMLVVGLYLGGIPAHTTDIADLRLQRGWYYLSMLKPQAVFDYKWFYLFLAATCLVVSVSQISWLKRCFETSICQYLGRISYALYLVHGPILETIGDRLYTAVGRAGNEQIKNLPWWYRRLPLPSIGPLGMEMNYLIVNLVLLSLTIWVAHGVAKAVDEPAVRFAQWCYKKTIGPPPEQLVKKDVDA